MIGEVGGSMEEEVYELLTSLPAGYPGVSKPIVGFIAGANVPPDRPYGHSGAIWREDEVAGGAPREKIRLWQKAGIVIAPSVAETANVMQQLLKERGAKL